MNFIFLLTTALAVSIDSFVCGLTLSFNCKKKLKLILGVTSVVFVLCLTANYLGAYLKNFLTEKTASLGGIILIAVGIINLFSKKDNNLEK